MKKILLTTSIAALLLQGAGTANAGFDFTDLHGTFGYGLEGQSGELGVRFVRLEDPDFGPKSSVNYLAGFTASIPNFVSEVGAFKADGHGGIWIKGTTFVTQNLGNISPTFSSNNMNQLTFETTYHCQTYKVFKTGRGTVECTRSDAFVPHGNPTGGADPLTREVLISFVIDAHNKEVRLHERQIPFATGETPNCQAVTDTFPVPNGRTTEGELDVWDGAGQEELFNAFQDEIIAQVDPLCFLHIEGSASSQS